MDKERELSLLALLEWEERVERWLQVPPPDREAFVQELAGLMVRHANGGGGPMSGSSRITNRHLERWAAVYVRQSTQNQVLRNRESRERQYGLADRARELGWPGERIMVIDSDLGQSAASQGTRSGFERLCEQVAQAGSARCSGSR